MKYRHAFPRLSAGIFQNDIAPAAARVNQSGLGLIGAIPIRFTSAFKK
ncbi:MAG: hypothetical protein HWQ35_33550 [Nostoc sp. NMS1]|nr:hypothetical protein [Nostoc sp. NMS1]MBN3911284.1 hypothetical protein [Nostoc sp. NMS1]MBN3995027.1 hypothetical protein [Nostoc sp. NMS2]